MIRDARDDAPTRRSAWRFILLVGVTNLFADMTYEGARGVTGDFLGKLGASGAIVGFVAGGGELAGYAVRSVSGIIADRTGRYWIDVWAGYIINMLCVPALALAGTWPVAAGLMIGERLGLSPEDAYMFCSLAVDMRVTQLVDGNKGIHAMLPKRYTNSPN